MKKILIIMLILALFSTLAGCVGGGSSIVGEWNLLGHESEGELLTIEESFFQLLTFRSDGTGQSETNFGGHDFSWSTNDGILTLVSEAGNTDDFDYDISGRELRLNSGHPWAMVFERVQ